jgi:hypothetical protein
MKTEKEIKDALRIMMEYLDNPNEPDILEVGLTQNKKKSFRIKIGVLKWVLEEKNGWQKIEAQEER